MKLSAKQVAASCAGAVLSAVIASLFGEKGTVIGVALGSVVATTTTALVAESIERTHTAVRRSVNSPHQVRRLWPFGAAPTRDSEGTGAGSPAARGDGTQGAPSLEPFSEGVARTNAPLQSVPPPGATGERRPAER